MKLLFFVFLFFISGCSTIGNEEKSFQFSARFSAFGGTSIYSSYGAGEKSDVNFCENKKFDGAFNVSVYLDCDISEADYIFSIFELNHKKISEGMVTNVSNDLINTNLNYCINLVSPDKSFSFNESTEECYTVYSSLSNGVEQAILESYAVLSHESFHVETFEKNEWYGDRLENEYVAYLISFHTVNEVSRQLKGKGMAINIEIPDNFPSNCEDLSKIIESLPEDQKNNAGTMGGKALAAYDINANEKNGKTRKEILSTKVNKLTHQPLSKTSDYCTQ